MLRLDASAAPLWRSPSALQLGDEPGAAVLDPVEPWHERVIHALVNGIPDELFDTIARDAGAPADEVPRLRRLLCPVLAEPRPRPSVALSFGDDVGPADRRTVQHAFAAAGAQVGAAQATANARVPGRVVVLVASRLVEPRRAAALVADDVAHLALELAGDRVTVGPLVVPGRTGCLACLHEHRRDRDAAWPVLAAQLLGRPCPPTDPALISAACAMSLQLISAPVTERTRSMTLRASFGEPTWHDHEPHPACWCRSPGRSETPAVRSAPRSEPTTASTFEQLA
jgi:bacteriocin biosynthesis cyclodehydratase domain-containing protein